MTRTITEAFQLPHAQDITAMGFVVKLRETEAGSSELKQLVDDYVITPAVEKELPRILDDMKQVFARGEEYGRFIHGSFGSGKSHFMTMLSSLLENVPAAWVKFRPLLAKGEHQAWIDKAGLLVVRVHMLSVRGRTTSFDRAIYEAFNAALKLRNKAPFEFLNLDAIFSEVRREAQSYGDLVWKQLEANGIIGGREDFEALASAPINARERFAKAWLQHKGRNLADAGIDPRWSEGLKRMTAHAKAQGFGGLVLMIDEFVLWLAEKSGQEFIQEINNLTMIVDHNTGQRAVPVFVFVARQRNLQEFFPDLVDESKIHEHIDHQAKRFEVTRLQDVELRHIVRGRVLRPKDPAAVAKVVNGLAEKHEKVLPGLLANADAEYLRDVYPFHPALIEMLVDVTSLMQRERSALRLLYELLVVHNPTLPLGEFLPVGSAFDAVFPPSGVEASKKVDLMQDIHHQFYSRLAPAIQKMAEEGGVEFTAERKRALEQLVKTVLLGAVSPRLRQGGLTIERLVQLNSVDVEGETYRGQVRVAETDLRALSTRLPDLQVAGTGKSATVNFVLGRVSLGEVLTRARSKVDNPAQRFKVFWAALRKALEIEGLRGFEEGGLNDGEWELNWRRTRRRGHLRLGNVREMAQADFEPPEGSFAVLVDYPWDDPGHTVDEDRIRATNARKKKGTLHTACWLPRHMTPDELSVMTELAAVRYLVSEAGQEDLLETFGAQDRIKLLESAGARATMLTERLNELLRDVYIHHGEFFVLINDVDTSRPRETLADNLEHIAGLLMDRRYPQHPVFLAEPRRQDLERLLEWMLDAGEQGVSVAYDEETGKVLRTLGQPLELVQLGQTKASLRLDSRYIKDVLQRADQESLAWGTVAEHLHQTYGFQPLVVELFLNFLCRRDHRAIEAGSGEAVEVHFGMSASKALRLQRGKVLQGAEWGDLRDLGSQLFGLQRPGVHRSLQAQDSFARQLREAAHSKRLVMQACHQAVLELGAEQGPRARELALANQWLSPLVQNTTDSFKVLSDTREQWRAEGAEALRTVVLEAERLRDALADVDRHTRALLESGRAHPTIGVEVVDHLATLVDRLQARQVERPLTKEWVKEWNAKARSLAQRLVQPVAPPPGPTPVNVVAPPPVVPAPASKVLLEAKVVPGDAASVDAFVKKLRAALAKVEKKSITLVVGEGTE